MSDLGAGQARITASSTDRFSLDLASGSVQDSITPTFAWSLSVSDASEAAVSGNPTLTATANQGSAAFNSGGVFYSASLLPEPFQTLTHFNPVYYMINLVRYGFLGYTEANIAISLAVLSLATLALFLFNLRLFKAGYKLRA